MSTEFDRPLDINIGTSWWLGVYLTLVHSGAVIIVCYIPLQIVFKGMIVAVVVVSFWFAVRKYVLAESTHRINRIKRSGNGEWSVFKGDTEITADHLESMFESNLFLLLRFSTSTRLLQVLLPGDCIDAKDYRQLRVVLRNTANSNTDKQH